MPIRSHKTCRCPCIMRQRCCQARSNTSLFVYVSAVGLFTFCNLVAIVLIQRHTRGKGEDTLEFENEDSYYGEGTFFIGDLLNNSPFHFNRSKSRTDKRRIFLIHDAVVVGDAFVNDKPLSYVTLATQCSVDRLSWLLEVATSWKAPMSIALFVPGVDFYIAKVYIAYLRQCSPVVRSNATFHMMYHRDMAPNLTMSYPKHTLPPCSKSSEALPLLMRYRPNSFKKWWQNSLHPQNHLRNLARQGLVTEYEFLTDIDIIPVSGLAKELDVFLSKEKQRTCKKCLYVVPTYEMLEKLPVPRSKNELLQRVQRKQCRPFHAKVFIHNQYATNHSLWEKTATSARLEAAYKVSNFEFFYEPFYVAKTTVPQHDERFVGYGYTRNTQVFEMYLAGYEFWVLNPAFAIHKGMQNKRGRGAWRERQNAMNRKQFVRFKHEMTLKYNNKPPPNAKRS